MIEVQALSKHFGPIKAVDGVEFAVRPGEILGFLGPNGAGKSTTMKLITGFLRPDRGTARIGGHDIATEPLRAKRLFGYLPETGPLYPEMSVRAFLRFCGEMRGLKGAALTAALEAVYAKCHLDTVLHQPLETLSKGYRQRVGLAQAVLHDPPYLIMDEPTDGLDPNQKHEVRRLIAGMARDKAILLSTHILEEVEAVCSRILIINHGRIVADATPAELKRQHPDHGACRLEADPGTLPAIRAWAAGAGIETKPDGEAALILRRRPPADALLSEVLAAVRANQWPVSHLAPLPTPLDVVFAKLTGNTLN